ncbi:MAG TPA: hypothetical protein VFD60_11200 [Nitrososphaeraceae archaeon]|jgi:hypothetical protein|nr:hypothetical protein [Nitrososphaeraceae archaeon]
MTKPLPINSLRDDIINKLVHTSDGFLIGNIHTMDTNSVVVKRNIIATIYYHIPINKIRGWDGHALWLNIDDKESKRHILPTESKGIKVGSMTLDLDEGIANNIRALAQSQGISLNTYLNQIIMRFLEWYRFEHKAGIIPISKPVLTELFNSRTKEEVIDIARRVGKSELQKTAAFMKGEEKKALDLNCFLSWLEAEMDRYSIEIRHTIKKNGNHHTYLLRHDAGEKYSLYYKTVIELIFEESLQKKIDIPISNNTTLAFEFHK